MQFICTLVQQNCLEFGKISITSNFIIQFIKSLVMCFFFLLRHLVFDLMIIGLQKIIYQRSSWFKRWGLWRGKAYNHDTVIAQGIYAQKLFSFLDTKYKCRVKCARFRKIIHIFINLTFLLKRAQQLVYLKYLDFLFLNTMNFCLKQKQIINT